MPIRKTLIVFLATFIPLLINADQKNIWTYLNPLSDLSLEDETPAEAQSEAFVKPKSDTLALRELMGDRVFFRAGLTKLNEDQVSVLYIWLQGYGQRPLEGEHLKSVSDNNEVKESIPQVFVDNKNLSLNKPIKTRMKAPTVFTGWHGHDIFYMENGQVWRQVGTEWYTPQIAVDKHPEVTIHQEGDYYYMEVEGISASLRVRLDQA